MLQQYRSRLARMLLPLHSRWLRWAWGHEIHLTALVSLRAFLDRTSAGITIGARTRVTRGATILCHDMGRGIYAKTVIGADCLIGVNAIVLAGVTIADQVVVGAGAVVTQDVPAGCVVAGNPARVLRRVRTGPYGEIIGPVG